MTSQQNRRRSTEKRIFDAAIALFTEQGYKKTTLIDIAQEAEVSTRTLYKYFPTKESILRKFGKENILLLKTFAEDLPDDMPVKEKVVEVMLRDFSLMFTEMDVSYILHSARDSDGMYARFEIENVLTTESIYCSLFKKEQLRCGIQPNGAGPLCASVVMAVYRHCNDLYRFREKGVFDRRKLKSFYLAHLDAVWDSLYETLTSTNYSIPEDSKSLFTPLGC